MSEEEATYEAPQAEEPAPPKRRARKATEDEAFRLPSERLACDIKVISKNKETALIEWYDAGEYVRGYVPAQLVKEDKVFYEDLDTATPYGAQWEEIVKLELSPEDIASALKAVGVWTFEDMAMDRRKVEAAILKLLRPTITNWIKTAKEAVHG